MPSEAHHLERFEYGGGSLVDEVLPSLETNPPSPHIVFLHGWRLTRDSLRAIGILFQPTHVVHLIDLPGFGDAPPPPADWDTGKYADLIQRYVDDRIRAPIVLVGHSFGGRIAVRLAGRRPPQLRGIVLMGVPGLPAPALSRSRLRRSAIRLLRRILIAVKPVTGNAPVDWHTRKFGSSDYLTAGELRPIFVRTVNENLTDSARGIACPALLIWGSEDRETPPWLAARYQSLLNGHATVEILPHKDHHLYTGTGAHLCAYKIRSWLEANAQS